MLGLGRRGTLHAAGEGEPLVACVLCSVTELKEFRATREYSTLKSRVPEKTLSKFPNLISFDPSNYHFSLTGQFEKAVAAAEKAADDYHRTRAPHAVHG